MITLLQGTQNLPQQPEMKPTYEQSTQNVPQQYASTFMCGTEAVSTGKLMRVEVFPLFSSISNFLQFLIVGLREEPLIRTLPSSLSSPGFSSKLNRDSFKRSQALFYVGIKTICENQNSLNAMSCLNNADWIRRKVACMLFISLARHHSIEAA